ncbi:MAG: aldehyde dehydrogenase family protein [Acidobacteria bacterium]|nr:MAG: aldehyde dehydrogenase family protein [Acidobacteriota bacterium]
MSESAVETRLLDAAAQELAARREAWRRVDVDERIALIDELSRGFARIAARWAESVLELEGLDPERPEAGEEWLVGPYLVLRYLHCLRRALVGVRDTGRPRIPGPITTRPDGQVVARVFPETIWDRLFYPGVAAEVWMHPHVTLDDLPRTQARCYHDLESPGRTCLVLGGGNVSSIGPLDALTKLFLDDRVVLFKLHPVNSFLAPLFEEAMAPLIDRGFLRIVVGGVAEGAHLCRHPLVDEIHVTGAEETYLAIVFGTGEDGARRRAEGRPLIEKPVTGELGNVSPVLVVPGAWSRRDLAYQATNIVSMLVNNAGFNCNAARVIVQHAGWSGRSALLDAIRHRLAATPTRRAYYPGAFERHRTFVEAHPEAERFGDPASDELPWTLIPGVPSDARDEICFEVEAFCGLVAETTLEAPDVESYLQRAVAFCNDTLYGSLNVTLVVDRETARHPRLGRAVERAVADLRYGTVCVNHWAALGFALGITPWGAYPGNEPHAPGSGIGVVHNALMFEEVEKAVIRTRFRAFPYPPWFVDHRSAHRLCAELTEFEARPSWARLPRVTWHALRA